MMVNAPRIAVIGSTNVDFVIRTKTLPRGGETVGGGTFVTVPGGKGANQALAARRLGADVVFHTCVGEDEFAGIALSNLRSAGVDLEPVVYRRNASTGAAFINVSENGENQIAVATGANGLLKGEDIALGAADTVIAQLEVSGLAIFEALRGCSAFFCLNTAPAVSVSDDLFHRAQLLVMNEVETQFYTDQLNGYDGMVARTYGAKGAALFRHGKKLAHSAAPEVAVVDTTGAGDTFTAALALALTEGRDESAALEFACAAGALATTRLGAQNGMPTRAEVERILYDG